MATKLSNATLTSLDRSIATPRYDRKRVTAGILHFGVGNFHRAHQAVYLDDLFNLGRDFDFGIIGAGVMAFDQTMRDRLSRQDFLTTVVEQEAHRSKARVTGSMVGYLPPGEAEAIIDRMSDPAIRIVSLTVTEGGYFINPATGRFDPGDPAIVVDGEQPDQPKTVFGLTVAGLKQRHAKGLAPFTVMSCDNIPHNGRVARSAVAGLARLSDPKLADWIESHVAFPNSMVDRITPATGERERLLVAEEFGIEDAMPVFCEDFRQWVLEDHFPAGRPTLEAVGVQFVPDVTPYENMKIRILNGGHAIIAYPSGLMDIQFAHEAMENRLIHAYLEKIEREEIIPIVPKVPGINLKEYYELIARRFSNPKIGDTIRRLCLDGSNRQPKFIIPSIADNLKKNNSVTGLALVSALWCRYCYGITDSGQVIEPNDPNWQRLQDQARKAKSNPTAWLEMKDIYGETADYPLFADQFSSWLTMLWDHGTQATLQHYLSDDTKSVPSLSSQKNN
jgi:mannitol 2-dehydrogenase